MPIRRLLDTKVEKALESVRMILDTTRHPRLAHEDEQHTYEDKFCLAEFLVNTGIAAQMNAFERIGLDGDMLIQVLQWVPRAEDEKGSLPPRYPVITLRFEVEDFCSFVKERLVDLPAPVERSVETVSTTAPSTVTSMGSSAYFGAAPKQSTETVRTTVTTKVREHHWKVGIRYRFIIFRGIDPEQSSASPLELLNRATSTVLITSGGTTGGTQPIHPIPERTIHPPIDVDLGWFFNNISPTEQICRFAIERNTVSANEVCKTPRRNPNVESAIKLERNLAHWTKRVLAFFCDRIEGEMVRKHNPIVLPEPDGTKSMPPGSIATICGLQKEPTFNGQQVKIVEYILEQSRYRVDPIDQSSGLPPTLLIKPQNLQASKEATGSVTQLSPPLGEIDDGIIFAPILPLLDDGHVLTRNDVAELLNKQTRSMDEAMEALSKMYPPRQLMKLVTVAEAGAVMMCRHLQTLSTQCIEGLDYIEDMLTTQLIRAIGQEVSFNDFERFMYFRHQQLFAQPHRPQPFSYSIRRPRHFPDGLLSIEKTAESDTTSTPIQTWVRQASVGPPIRLPINAATTIQLGGERFLHGWIQHRFQSGPSPSYQLVARARQFSSFLLMIGTIVGPENDFEPTDAIILQNKDEVLIPLLCNTIPSPKEFNDLIASLSPTQQEFARSFRAMQLESSVFAVCVVQLKPQLEKLLGLPAGSLTKQIQLTQDLLSLFVEYQIPSDFLSLDESENELTTASEKISLVKDYVKNVMDVLDKEKKRQLTEETMKSDMKAELLYQESNHQDRPPNLPTNASDMDTTQDMLGDIERSNTSLGSPKVAKSRRLRTVALNAPSLPPIPMAVVQNQGARSMVREAIMPDQVARVHSEAWPQGKQVYIPPSLRKQLVQPVTDSTRSKDNSIEGKSERRGVDDFTLIPKVLDSKIELYDSDSSLRSTIIKASRSWTRRRQHNLLSSVASSVMDTSAIEEEHNKAFDLLDAISRSGTLPIDCAEVHVVISLTHSFENDVMGTVIQDNVNPITKVERSSLLLASTIAQSKASALLALNSDVERLTSTFPDLMGSPVDER